MLSTVILLTVACELSRTAGLNEHEWRNNIVKAYGNLTKYVNHRDFVKYRELFDDDSEIMMPGMSLAYKEELMFERNRFMKKNPVSHMYASFVELLYSSPDVALVRDTQFAELVDGTERTTYGLAMLVRDDNGVKFKLGIYTLK